MFSSLHLDCAAAFVLYTASPLPPHPVSLLHHAMYHITLLLFNSLGYLRYPKHLERLRMPFCAYTHGFDMPCVNLILDVTSIHAHNVYCHHHSTGMRCYGICLVRVTCVLGHMPPRTPREVVPYRCIVCRGAYHREHDHGGCSHKRIVHH